MSILEKTYEVLSTNEAKRDHLRKFILLLMLEWKEFEGHLDLTEKFFQERVAELQSRETHLSSVQESVNKSSLEVNLIRKSIDQRFEEVLEKEKEFKLLQEKETKELKLLNETLSRICKEVEVREEKLNEQEKLIQVFFEKIELEQKQFEVIQNLVGERFNEIWLKEKQIEQRVHELDLKGQKLMQREKEIELREKILDLRKKEIELKEGEFDSAKISKKQSPVLDSGEKNGLQPKGQGNFAPSSRLAKKSSVSQGQIAAHNVETVIDRQNEKPQNSSVDLTTISKPCCQFYEPRIKNSSNKDFFCNCKNCTEFFVAIESASYEGYNSEKFKPGTGIERNDDIGEDARSKENDGNITILDVGKGYLDIPVDDDTEPRESRELMNNGRKRGSTGTENDVIVTEQVFGVDDYHYSRTSYDLLQTLRRLSRVDETSSSSKRLRGEKPSSCSEDKQNNATVHNHSACGYSTGFSTDVDNGMARMEYEGTAPTEESLPRCNENVDFVDVSVSDSAGSDDTDKGIINCPVPEFSDFDKHREQNCFSVDQIWACYDNTPDAMPRFYAQVRKVYSHGFKLQLCWLDPHPDYQGGIDWARKGLPVACGQFACGYCEDTTNINMFSHQVIYNESTNACSYTIYPRKGEIWALFKNWDIEWICNTESHKSKVYEFVEVLTEFVESTGIRVAVLDKVRGYLSLFRQTIRGNSFLIPPNELLRFSHQVPFCRMTGNEEEGVPEGSFELDPASMPVNL